MAKNSARRAGPTSTLVHTRETLAVPSAGSLRLAIVADTHGQPHPASSSLIAAQRPDRILHAGDIGDLAVLDELARIAPVLAIRGNIEAHSPRLPDAITIDVRDGDVRDGEATLARLLLFHIAVFGPKLRADAARLAHAEDTSIVVCGHSHVPFIGRDKGLVIVNPGSIGPRRFQLPIVFAVMDIGREQIGVHHVSCETGLRWAP